MKFTYNVPKLIHGYKNQIAEDLDAWMIAVKEMVDLLTPEDTWVLIANNKRDAIKISWDLIVWRVHNDTSYAIDVEEWMWRTFSYQKPKGNKWRYVWEWVHTYERALAATEPIILQFLKR